MASDGNNDEDLKTLRNAAKNYRYWLHNAAKDPHYWPRLRSIYQKNKHLRTEKLTKIGDTALHVAVSSGEMHIIRWMLKEGVEKDDDEKKRVLRATNDRGDTPLHLAASSQKESFKMCKMLGEEIPSLISSPNKFGETPLFMAARHGNKEAFLWLHYNSIPVCAIPVSSTPDKNLNDDTVLHCAIPVSSTPDKNLDDDTNLHSAIPVSSTSNQNLDNDTNLHSAIPVSSTPDKNLDDDTILHCAIPVSSTPDKNLDDDCEISVSPTLYKNNDDDTILHCAISGGHIDVAIEIIHLYKEHVKDMAIMRNKNGLCPIHILAATPSVFESTDLSRQSFLVRWLYQYLLCAKPKTRATMKEELKHPDSVSFVDCAICCLGFTLSGAYYCYDRKCPRVFGTIIMVIVLLLVMLFLFLLAPLFGLRYLFVRAGIWFHEIRKLKEKHTWSLQILEKLLQHALEGDVTSIAYPVKDSEEELIVDPPEIIAAQNGVEEWVSLPSFRDMMPFVNEEGKNIVLLAVEKRQTKLYQLLYENENVDKSLFMQVDKDGNTALHLAAKLGLNLNMQTTTMIEEFKFFQFVKSTVPSELWEKCNKEGKTAEDIFRDSYKEHMTSDRVWLNQTSQACSVASTLVAGMAFSNFAGENIDKKNDSSLVALSLSLTSTICFLAILAFRSQSTSFWRYVPFMLHLAILTMFGSIVALWMSLTFQGKSLTTYAILGKSVTTYVILGTPIAILTIISLPIFIGPTLRSMFAKLPAPSRPTTSAIRYRRPQKKENRTDFDRESIKPTPN